MAPCPNNAQRGRTLACSFPACLSSPPNRHPKLTSHPLQLSACEGVLPRITSIRPLVLRASGSRSNPTDGEECPTGAAAPSDSAGTHAACQHPGGQQHPSGEHILVRGSALLGEHCRLLVRSGGTYPLVEILATSGPLGTPCRTATTAGIAGGSSVFAQEDEWLEIRCAAAWSVSNRGRCVWCRTLRQVASRPSARLLTARPGT